MAKNDWRPTDDEVSKAHGVLERQYRSWVKDLAEELVFETFNDDIDEDELRERLDERTDSGLVYTSDQWTALFNSRSTDEALDEMDGMGYFERRPENLVGVWATLTYRADVSSEVWDDALTEPIRDGMDLEERITWLIEEHGKKTVELADDRRATIIGDVSDISFGVLVVEYNSDGDYVSHDFIGRYLPEQPGSLEVLLDIILEEGVVGPRAQEFLKRVR